MEIYLKRLLNLKDLGILQREEYEELFYIYDIYYERVSKNFKEMVLIENNVGWVKSNIWFDIRNNTTLSYKEITGILNHIIEKDKKLGLRRIRINFND